MERPIIYAMRTIHLSDDILAASSSHLSIIHTVNAVRNEENEYTSPSTAENQKVSVNAYSRAPVNPLNMIKEMEEFDRSSRDFSLQTTDDTRYVIVRNRKNIHPALRSAFITFIQYATSCGEDAKSENTLPANIKNGAPGG